MDYRVIYVGSQIIFGILFLVLLFLRHTNNRGQRLDKLDALYCLFLLTVALDSIWILIDGIPQYRIGHIILQVTYLSTMAFVGYLWFLFTLDLFPAKSLKLRKYRFALGIPVLLEIVAIFCSIKTGWVFIVDANGAYTRGNFHIHTIILNYIYLLLGSYVALQCRKNALLTIDKRRFTVAALFPVPVLLLSAAQMILPPGLPAMQGGVLIGLLLLFGTSQNAMITQDYLTGLPNRYAFEQDLLERIHRFHAGGPKHLYVLEGDLNKFKHINDTYGHPEGDRILLETARVLNRVFPAYGAAVFRTGGDEFMMVAETEDEFDVNAIDATLNAQLANIETPDDSRVTMSLGMEEYDESVNFRVLIENVDQKLYAAKANSPLR